MKQGWVERGLKLTVASREGAEQEALEGRF